MTDWFEHLHDRHALLHHSALNDSYQIAAIAQSDRTFHF